MAEPKTKLYKSTTNPPVFEEVKGILKHHGVPLTPAQMWRLKSEALTIKTTLLYELLGNKTADKMQREIVENHTEAHPNGKDERTYDFYRAILADRRIFISEIESWASLKMKQPTLNGNELPPELSPPLTPETN